MDTLWRIELFGTLRLTREDRVITQFDTRKTAALLGRLAYFPDRLHTREILAEILWPEEEPEVTRSRLRQALSVLRRALEPAGVPPETFLKAGRAEVGLVPGRVITDVAQFEQRLKTTLETTDHREQADRFAQAIEFYGGELLPGYYEEWIAPERERLAELYRGALLRLASLKASLGDLESAIMVARRAVRADPLEEETHHALIRFYMIAGRITDATRQFRELERTLREAFGAAPSPNTFRLLSEGSRHVQVMTGQQAISRCAPVSEQIVRRTEPEGGAVPLQSLFYIERPTDAAFENAISRGDSIVLVKGAREIGKTSLLARGIQKARETGARVVLTDLQTLTSQQMETADTLFLTLAEGITEQLELDISLDDAWNPKRGWNVNFEKFLRRDVLGRLEMPLVWAVDEVDRLFGHAYSTEVFGLFRSWHNQRALNPFGPWSKFTLAIAYATEAHLFIKDLNQSPFNVGTRLTLEDFTREQVERLNRLYESPLATPSEIDRFFALVGGHPALVRRGLQEMAARRLDIQAVEAEAESEEGLFGNHLRNLLQALQQDPALCDALHGLLQGNSLPSEVHYYRLHSAGLLSGLSSREARPRCGLYQRYLERRLP